LLLNKAQSFTDLKNPALAGFFIAGNIAVYNYRSEETALVAIHFDKVSYT